MIIGFKRKKNNLIKVVKTKIYYSIIIDNI